jgi:guanylate kinase
MSRLIILSGPSGSGKSTVVQRLLARGDLPLRQSISATTRGPRPGEVDGVHYHFWDRDRFLAGVEAGEFLEHAEVVGQQYGTPRSEVFPYLQRGVGVILVIDVQGAAQVRRKCPEAFSIFLHAPSMEELERRLRARHSEDEAAIRKRLANAEREVARAGEYDYQMVNESLDAAVGRLHTVIKAVLAGEPPPPPGA